MTSFVNSKITLFALVVFSFYQITNAQFLYQDCYDGAGIYSSPSHYGANIDASIARLASLASTSYFNTVSVGKGFDKVNALFYCRYDVTPDVCQSCVASAANYVPLCFQSIEAIEFYEECTVHYSNRIIASVFDDLPRYSVDSVRKIKDNGEFNQLVAKTFTSLIRDTVTGFSVSSRYFATTTAKYSAQQTLYALAECNEDLTSFDCYTCLRIGFGNFTEKYPGSFLGEVFMPSCRLSYKLSSVPMTAPYDFTIVIISNTQDSFSPLSSPPGGLAPLSSSSPDEGLAPTPTSPSPSPLSTPPHGLLGKSAGSTGAAGMSATIASISMVLLCFGLLL